MSNWLAKNLELFLPKYLTETAHRGLVKSLSQFPGNIDKRLFLSGFHAPDGLLQGDGISASSPLSVCHWPFAAPFNAPCILLSNSCDMEIGNIHKNPAYLLFAPIFNLKKLLERRGDKDDNFATDLRRQYITQYFYLPPSRNLRYEGFVCFDQVCAAPLTHDLSSQLRDERIFSFSQYGFYLFLFKLSVHFTRMGEGIDRDTL